MRRRREEEEKRKRREEKKERGKEMSRSQDGGVRRDLMVPRPVHEEQRPVPHLKLLHLHQHTRGGQSANPESRGRPCVPTRLCEKAARCCCSCGCGCGCGCCTLYVVADFPLSRRTRSTPTWQFGARVVERGTCSALGGRAGFGCAGAAGLECKHSQQSSRTAAAEAAAAAQQL